MRPENLESYRFMTAQCFSDMSQGYENQRGEYCNHRNPEVQIKFKQSNVAYISKIEVQREHRQNPGNTRQIEVNLIGVNNSFVLDDISDSPLVLKSSESEPIIWGYFKDIRGINLKVAGTDNNENLKGLRIKITGCYTTGQIYIVYF